MYRLIQATVFLTFFVFFTANSVETGTEKKGDSTLDLGKMIKLQNQKFLMTPPKTTKKIFNDHLETINSECCEDDYSRKEEIYSIKNILEDCLNSNCQNKLIPIYDPKKPPLKILAFKEIKKLDSLILDHEKFRYDKLSKKIENKDLKSLEKDEIISEFKKENQKLKKTVDKMLVSYQKKISKLEKENKQLQENFNKAFEMLPKSKQKKIENN